MRTRGSSVAWITPQNKGLIRSQDFQKKYAIKYAPQSHWERYQNLRNRVNNEMRSAKSKFFHDKIGESSELNDSRKTWTLIDSLSGRNNKLKNVSTLSVNENKISDSKSIAKAFNHHFMHIAPKLAAECGDEQCSNTEPLVT